VASISGEQAPLAGETRETKDRRWWREPATVAAVVAAVGTILSAGFAGTTWWEAHQTDRANSLSQVSAAIAARMAQARLVSLHQETSDPKTTVVQNLSQQPVYNSTVMGTMTHGGRDFLEIVVPLGELPPCSDTMVNFGDPRVLRTAIIPLGDADPHPFLRISSAGARAWHWRPQSLQFTDAVGLSWLLSDPLFAAKGSDAMSLSPDPYVNVSLTQLTPPTSTAPATGCA